MEQMLIGQRLKILIEALGLKVRTFAQALGVSETTVRNYLDRGSKPSSDFLENIVTHFEKTNPVFLLTGNGEPLVGIIDSGIDSGQVSIISSKNNSGNVAGTNRGTMTQTISHFKAKGSGETDVTMVTLTGAEHDALHREIELLRAQVADKERTIQILLKQNS